MAALRPRLPQSSSTAGGHLRRDDDHRQVNWVGDGENVRIAASAKDLFRPRVDRVDRTRKTVLRVQQVGHNAVAQLGGVGAGTDDSHTAGLEEGKQGGWDRVAWGSLREGMVCPGEVQSGTTAVV